MICSDLILEGRELVPFPNKPPEELLAAVFGDDQCIDELLGGDIEDVVNLYFFECLNRVLSCLSYSLADLHLPTTLGNKPVATSQVQPFISNVFTLSMAVSRHCITRLPETDLDRESKVDQAIFSLLNIQYVPNAIIDAHNHLDPQWRTKDPEAVTAHTVAMAVVECLSEDDADELCRRCDEVGRLPSLTMIFAAVRGRGCTLLCHEHVRHQLSFGITLDRIDGERVFCSPLFLLLRPSWRVDDLDQDEFLADVFSEDCIPRLVENSHLDRNGLIWSDVDRLQLMFALRYLITFRTFKRGFGTFASNVASLVEATQHTFNLPPPTFVSFLQHAEKARAARDFRRSVVCALEALKTLSKGTTTTTVTTVILVFMATAADTHLFARALSSHNTAAATDSIISAIELEDKLRGALSSLSTLSELHIATARHMIQPPNNISVFCEYMSECAFLDEASKDLAALIISDRNATFTSSRGCAKRYGTVVVAVASGC